jgi:hypothetical protein
LNEIYPSITLPNEKSYKRKSTISAESWVVGIPGSEFIKSVNPDPLQKARGEFTTRHLVLPKPFAAGTERAATQEPVAPEDNG